MKNCPFCGDNRVVKDGNNYDCKECGVHIEFDEEDHWEERNRMRYLIAVQDMNGYYYKWVFDDKAEAEARLKEYKDKGYKIMPYVVEAYN